MHNLKFPLDLGTLKENDVYDLKDKIPDDFFKIEHYNDIAFVIQDHLYKAFDQCNHLLINKNSNKYNNLIALFYHHINALLCSYYYCISELQEIKKHHSNIFFTNQQKEWSISYSQISSKNFNHIKPKISSRTRIRDLINYINTPSINKNNSNVFIYPGISINIKIITEALKSDNIQVFKNKNIFSDKVCIDFVEKQFIILEKAIEKISKQLKTLSTEDSLTEKELFQIIVDKIKRHISTKEKKYDFDLVIMDSLGDLGSRKIAMQCKLQNIPVIGICHGESSGIMDEPVFGPVELTYCNYYIGYGKRGCNSLKNGIYTKSLFDDEIEIIPSNSNKVLNIYEDDQIGEIANFHTKNIMYVPTSFTGTARYGPFRDIHDFAYLSWQNDLLQAIESELNPLKILLKYHPKDNWNFYLNTNGMEIIKDGEFVNLIDKADIFVFDFAGSAFSLRQAQT